MIPRRAIVPVLAAAAVAGCNAIFGIHAGEPFPGSGGGTSTSTGTAGGGTSTSTGASTSTSSTTTGGSGGAPPSTKLVPAGTFAFLNEQNGKATPATITHDFYLDDLEVTVDRFKAWVQGGQKLPCQTGTCSLDPGGPYEQTMLWDSAWNTLALTQSFQDPTSCNKAGLSDIHTPTYTLADGSLPMGCLDWYHAVAFCASEGKRLPTETEWQYVASGRGLGRTYPWGDNDPSGCTLALWNNSAPAPSYNGCSFPQPGGSTPTGASHDGFLDMAGSVFEWTWDYDGIYPEAAVVDYTGPLQQAYRSTRGGSWALDMAALRTTYRDATDPGSAFADVGVRCARTKVP